MVLELIATMSLAAEPGSCTGATGVRITFKDHARGTALFDRVKVGWTAKRLREHLGIGRLLKEEKIADRRPKACLLEKQALQGV